MLKQLSDARKAAIEEVKYFKFFSKTRLISLLNLQLLVVCCCKLNNTWICDEHLFGQVSTCKGRYQLPIFRGAIMHQ